MTEVDTASEVSLPKKHGPTGGNAILNTADAQNGHMWPFCPSVVSQAVHEFRKLKSGHMPGEFLPIVDEES